VELKKVLDKPDNWCYNTDRKEKEIKK